MYGLDAADGPFAPEAGLGGYLAVLPDRFCLVDKLGLIVETAAADAFDFELFAMISA